MARANEEGGTAVAEAPKQTTTPIVPLGVNPQQPEQPAAFATIAAPTKANSDPGVILGDDVYFIAPGFWHAGVINPQIQAAKVAGILPDGRLTLYAFGRMPMSIHVGVEYDVTGKKPNTWHKKPK